MSVVKKVSLESILELIGGERVYTVGLGHIVEELGYYQETISRINIGGSEVTKHLILWRDKNKLNQIAPSNFTNKDHKVLSDLKAKCCESIPAARSLLFNTLRIISTEPPHGGLSVVRQFTESKFYKLCIWLTGVNQERFEAQLDKFKVAHELISKIPRDEAQILLLPKLLNSPNIEIGQELVVVKKGVNVGDRNWAQRGIVKSFELYKELTSKSTGVELEVVITINGEDQTFVFYPKEGKIDKEYSVSTSDWRGSRVFSDHQAALDVISTIKREFNSNIEAVKKNISSKK